MIRPLDRITTLTFDIFGTVLDLTGGIVPAVRDFLAARGSSVAPTSSGATGAPASDSSSIRTRF